MFRWMSPLARGWHVFVSYGLERDTLVRSIKTALVVGSILGLINHGPALLTGHFTADQLAPLLLTYFVPFSVATYGQIQGKRQRDHIHQQKHENEELSPTLLESFNGQD
ncbi:MAG: nitrate/nitrite transporter NrtS [Ktedonobacteraceae bacterium]